MNQNPTYQNNETQPPELRVTLVTRSGNYTAEDVAHFCKNNNIEFMTRQYDARTYSEDREEITHLPAFHIYEVNSNVYISTLYLTEVIIEYIQQQLETYNKREAIAKERRAAWIRRMSFLTNLFKLPKVSASKFRKSKSMPSFVLN